SKLAIEEVAYAAVDFKDFSSNDERTLERFKLAYHHHKRYNPHHPEYWFDVKKDGRATPLAMPRQYVAEMVADWMGAGKTYGQTLTDWLPENLPNFLFHKTTALQLAELLTQYVGITTRLKDNSKGRLEVV
ncbi:MAG: DUF5662 family protein, partial [Bacteroidota bacterium]